MKDERTAVQLSDDLFADHFPNFRKFREDRVELLSFLAGNRYDGDTGEFNKDRRGVQIRGQQITDTNDHVLAKVTEKARSIEGRPNDQDTDPDLAEQVVSLVTNHLADPFVGFDRENYACLSSAINARAGCLWMDWNPESGEFGRLIYSWQDMNKLMWDLPWHPHHPMCGWMVREKRIDVGLARRIYKAPWLEADKASLAAGGSQFRQGVPLIDGYTDRLAATCAKDNKITIRELWIKNDPTEAPEPVTAAAEPIPIGYRYMSCQYGCGFRSPTESILAKQGALPPGGELPEDMPSACPTCAGNLMRIDAREVNHTMLAYERGRRLIITAPLSPNPNGKPLFDGSWPLPGLRSFPARFSFASVQPGGICGPCNTDKMWDQQVASDNLKTLAIARVFEHRNMWVMPAQGFVDKRNKRFEFRNDQGNVIFEDARFTKNGPLKIQNINATGLDPNWSVVNADNDNSLTRYRPSGDLSLTQDQSKDIAVGTAEIIQQQGETQTSDFIRRDNLELSMFYGVVVDALYATITPEELQRMNIEGADELMALWGDNLPSMDFVITESPAFTGIDKARAQAFQTAMTVGQQYGPDALTAWGKFNNISPSLIREVQKIFVAQAEQAAAMGVPPGGDGSLPPGDGMPPGGGMEAAGATESGTPLDAAA